MLLDTASPWSSLEVSKLLVSGLTPVIVIIGGLFLNRILKKFEHRQWRNQKLIEKRLAIYDELAPLLNDVLCYYTYVGNWKDNTPVQLLSLKRTIDKKVYLAAPLFCTEFFFLCMKFINLCYEPYTGWGEDAKLRTMSQRRKDSFTGHWDRNWDHMFCSNNCTDPHEIKEVYLKIMNIFSQEIGLQENYLTSTGKLPENII